MLFSSKKHAKDPDSEAPVLQSELFGWVDAIISALIFIIFVFAFLFRTSGVVGTSMVPTLQDNDQLIVSHLFYTPAQGDIVVVRKSDFLDIPIVKRIIATEGQTIDIDFVNGIVTVDGKALDEPYINELTTTRGDMTFPATVPEGCVFVMGDNRNASTDSRFSPVGMVDTRMILGKVVLRYFPFTSFGSVYK